MDSGFPPPGKDPGKDPAPFRRAARGDRVLFPVKIVWCVLALVPLLFAPACGYRLQGRPGSAFSDSGITVDLRPFANESLIPDAGAYLASRLREEMRRTGFQGRFERSRADYLVEGKLEAVREEVFARGEDDFAIEFRMTVSVNIRVVEITQGRLLWKEDGLAETAYYYAGSDFQFTESNRRIAFEEICRRLARRIVQTMREIL